MTEHASSPQFAQAAYVTKGPWYVKHGVGLVTIVDGVLTLRGRKGDVLVEQQLGEVQARPRKGDFGGKVLVQVPDGKYIVSWAPEETAEAAAAAGVAGAELGGAGLGLGMREVAKLPAQRQITEQFLTAVKASGGHAG